ncbi:MAG: DUF2333 family protein [Pseudomonadota bacterium]
MLDPIIAFFTRIFALVGKGIGMVIGWFLWPFLAVHAWYKRQKWLIRVPVALLVLAIIVGYGYFFYATQFWHGYDRDYAKNLIKDAKLVSAGSRETSTATATGLAEDSSDSAAPAGRCEPSRMVSVTADLIDFSVNQNNWVPSMLLSKFGMFFITDWKSTPFMDNKAAFQLGVLQTLRRTSVELVDRLGRVRGTSSIDQNLQNTRQYLAYDEDSWYFSFEPFGPRSTAQANYRRGIVALRAFNKDLAACKANFDARPDNLLQFLDRVTSDIGSTSDILRRRMEASNAGWFDPRADDRFWFAYGQLYGYYGILTAARADFADVFQNRNLEQLWIRTEEQLRSSLNLTPAVISNGHESSWIMPTHLATMGFYLLRVRSNLVEIRDVLDR